jgi:hypothetical protein
VAASYKPTDMPVADLGRVSDFVEGLHDAKIERDKKLLKVVAGAALGAAAGKIWSVYRADKRTGRR